MDTNYMEVDFKLRQHESGEPWVLIEPLRGPGIPEFRDGTLGISLEKGTSTRVAKEVEACLNDHASHILYHEGDGGYLVARNLLGKAIHTLTVSAVDLPHRLELAYENFLAGIDPDDFPSEKMKREFDVIVAGIKGNGEPVEIASKIWKLWRRIPA